jgi:predicted GTPase
MPGLGEDIEKDAEHHVTYQRVLPGCDVALWILKADARPITHVQRSLLELTARGALEPRRLVVGMNQVDLVQPGEWRRDLNLPSEEQEETIQARLADVHDKLARVVELPRERVVAYSALRAYRLDQLVKGIELACDRSRSWLIEDRANFLDFHTLAEDDDGRP